MGTISGRHRGRLLSALDLKPHRTQYWLNAKVDPKRNEKIDAICEVYHSAEEAKKMNIETVCVDEMTGVQARIAPDQTMRPGQPQRIEYEYKRHGTQCLLAAMDVVTGKITGDCRAHRKETDFLEFIQMLDILFSGCARLRIVIDNLNTHQSALLVEYVAAHIGYAADLGVKGVSGILKDQQSRAEFLADPTHCIAFLLHTQAFFMDESDRSLVWLHCKKSDSTRKFQIEARTE